MDKKPLISKWLAVGIILLFVGIALSPATSQKPFKSLNYQQISTSDFLVNITCQYYTSAGQVNVTRQLSEEDANALSKLLNGTDDDAIISKLTSFQLMPTRVSLEQLKSYFNGDFLKKIYEKLAAKINRLTFDNSTPWNFLCLVRGDAEWVAAISYKTLAALLVPIIPLVILELIMHFFSLYPIHTFFNVTFWGGKIPIGIFGALASIYVSLVQMFPFPVRLALVDVMRMYYNASLETIGLLGSKTCSGNVIEIEAFGFFGLVTTFQFLQGEKIKIRGCSAFIDWFVQ